MRFFVELVGHYPYHIVESSRGSRELQRDSFRKSHPSRGVRQFLQLFMDTQMFAGFIQDKELRKGGGRGNGDAAAPLIIKNPARFFNLIVLTFDDFNSQFSFCLTGKQKHFLPLPYFSD